MVRLLSCIFVVSASFIPHSSLPTPLPISVSKDSSKLPLHWGGTQECNGPDLARTECPPVLSIAHTLTYGNVRTLPSGAAACVGTHLEFGAGGLETLAHPPAKWCHGTLVKVPPCLLPLKMCTYHQPRIQDYLRVQTQAPACTLLPYLNTQNTSTGAERWLSC